MRISDWSSDVCSSDLRDPLASDGIVGVDQVDEALVAGKPEQRRDAGEVDVVAQQHKAPRPDVLAQAAGSIGEDDALAAERLQGREGEVHARSEEHTYELQSLMCISYAVFCLKKKILNINISSYI